MIPKFMGAQQNENRGADAAALARWVVATRLAGSRALKNRRYLLVINLFVIGSGRVPRR